MKLVKAFVHHIRSAAVVEALGEAGYRNLTLQDVRGMLKPITLEERDYTREASGLVISEARISLVVDDAQVERVTAIIRKVGRIGPHVSGWVYVSPVEQALPIGGPE